MSLLLRITLSIILVSNTIAKEKHPGCMVWWFVPGCPLEKIFGTDPFGIYPWKKFCIEYSDFESIPKCEGKTKPVNIEECGAICRRKKRSSVQMLSNTKKSGTKLEMKCVKNMLFRLHNKQLCNKYIHKFDKMIN
uniref:BPTI/Kunitz inhibitor domain-containing protein n=1 Tax=Lepeophtheirus salmonis TaxID=72036 RepID=A0A0K2SZW3_LEPSM